MIAIKIAIIFFLICNVKIQCSWLFPNEIPPSTESLKIQRISEIKCDNYKELTVEHEFAGGLTFDSEPDASVVHKCDIILGLIVGGFKVETAQKFPHMAAIGWKTDDNNIEFACGGSLISEKHVLTVAHCYKKTCRDCHSKFPTIVRLGDQNLQKVNDNAEPNEYIIEQFIKHENYNSRTRKNDIAIIKLAEEVIFTKFIRPACLPQDNNFHATVIATGWGRTSNNGQTSDDLNQVDLKVVEWENCINITQDEYKFIHDSQICAGSSGFDTCLGDSGGPIQIIRDDNPCVYDIIGLTSYGTHCGSNTPSLYTRVFSYLDWIEQKVWIQN